MTLDELIALLLEAKDHCLDGRDKVEIYKIQYHHPVFVGYIEEAYYKNDKVHIVINDE